MEKEQRLIDANALEDKLSTVTITLNGLRGTKSIVREFLIAYREGVLRIIADQPTVEAVEVVRCKDCKWFNAPGCAIYIVDDTDKPKENDFCSFGERRTDNVPDANVGKWIPVTERLPTDADADDLGAVLAVHKASRKKYYHWRSVADNPFDFTHWMPLPEAPKGE